MIEELSIEKAIEFAIKTEDLGERIYNRLAKQFKDSAELHELFSTLAGDERFHRSQFETIRDKLPKADGPIQYEQDQYLRAMSISDIFSSSQGIAKDTEAVLTREDALQRALDLEKSSLMYYYAMQDILGPNETLESVIQVEKSHVVQVMKYLVTSAKMRGLGDNF